MIYQIGPPERACTFCGSDISHKRAGAIYCSDPCRLKASRKAKQTAKKKTKRRPKMTPFQHFAQSTFGIYLVDYCRRVNTVQIFPHNISVEELAELWEMMKFKIAANGIGEYRLPISEGYDLCHLAPAIGKDGSTGYLIPRNLVIAPASINRSIGNMETIYSKVKGLSLPKKSHLLKWRVSPEVTPTAEQILRRLNRYLNGTLELYQARYDHKCKSTAVRDVPPLDTQTIMAASLAHVQKYHSDLFNPTAVIGYSGIVAIAPEGMEKVLPDVSLNDSWRYLLTGIDTEWRTAASEPFELRYVDLGNYDDWGKPIGGWVRYPSPSST